jgi:threonine synthase
MPEAYPRVNTALLDRWRDLSYAELAFEIVSLYADDIPSADLRSICTRTYTPEVFGSEAIVPVRTMSPGFHIAGLSNGPSLAFKDMAMQLLGNLLEYELGRRGEDLNILGATSGDTGSAAEYAMRGKRGIRVFMMSPHGRMSAFQQAQMFSLLDDNIHNIAVEGVFDDCQDIVKVISGDADFKRRHRIGAVNSINWARLVAQVVYYFWAYFRVAPDNAAAVDFTVPSGNFGNVCAGHVARMMGLPISRLVVATNENDVLDEFFRTGFYRVRARNDTFETSSPSMDISKASNLERFLFDLIGRDADRTRSLMEDRLRKDGSFDLGKDPVFVQAAERYGFRSGRSTHADRLATIRECWERYDTLIDPHTADAVKVAKEHAVARTPMIVLETALPVKFATTIHEAVGQEPPRPARFEGVEDLPKRFKVLPADAAVVRAFVAETLQVQAG